MFSPYRLGIVKLCEGPPKRYVGLIKINTSRIDAQPNIEQSQASFTTVERFYLSSRAKAKSKLKTGVRYIMGCVVFRSHCESFTTSWYRSVRT